MKFVGWAVALALTPLAAAAAVATSEEPTWAFFFQRGQPLPPSDEKITLPGSTKAYTRAEINDIKNPPDWYPDEHPVPPSIVVKGHDTVGACASCHIASGIGHPESSSLAGLSANYFKEQIADFRSGARVNPIVIDGKPAPSPLQNMIAMSKGMSPEEIDAAAAYYAGLKLRPMTKVVETAIMPKTYLNAEFVRLTSPGAEKEPLGHRIIELPEIEAHGLARDPHAISIAYVPVGSLARGKALATSGACGACHAPDMRGGGDIPGIAGRSPLYTIRELWSFKQGFRSGADAAPMKAIVANMSTDDMIAVSAYVASLKP